MQFVNISHKKELNSNELLFVLKYTKIDVVNKEENNEIYI